MFVSGFQAKKNIRCRTIVHTHRHDLQNPERYFHRICVACPPQHCMTSDRIWYTVCTLRTVLEYSPRRYRQNRFRQGANPIARFPPVGLPPRPSAKWALHNDRRDVFERSSLHMLDKIVRTGLVMRRSRG